jgi:short-subunit dehydrogenase
LTQTPGQVAKEVIKSLKHRKKPTVNSGPVNKAFVFMTRFMPRKAVVSMIGKV